MARIMRMIRLLLVEADKQFHLMYFLKENGTLRAIFFSGQ
jgi:hypothetical protein